MSPHPWVDLARPARPPGASPTVRRLESSECVRGLPWLHHLPLSTFQQARKFRASPADPGLYGTFGYAQNLGYLFVIKILQVSQDYSLAQLHRSEEHTSEL